MTDGLPSADDPSFRDAAPVAETAADGPRGGPVTRGDPLAGDRTTVVGGGIGGLAAAATLADAGADVTVLERNERLGGVANLIEADGFRFDTGPTWYLMPEVFERFFGRFGRSPEEFYDLERLDPHYRVFWKGGDDVEVTGDVDQIRSLFESYEAGAGQALDEYLEESRYTYEVGMERFVYRDRSRFRDLVDPSILPGLPGVTLLGSMQDHVEDYFDHPKLHQLLQYTLVFLGGSPYNTPALYNLMTHVDYDLGVYYPEGGLYSVVEALVELGEDLGVTYETGTEVTGIRPGPSGTVVETAGGGDPGSATGATGRIRTRDAVVANANPAHVERDLLPDSRRDHDPGYWETRTYAPSAFMLYLGVEGGVGPLAHHTLVFPTDWDPHFESIFEDPGWPADPAYYLAVPSKTDPEVAPDGHHAVVVLVPIAPGLDDGLAIREQYRGQILADLADTTGVDLRDRIVFERSACVSDFARRYRNPGGTALGLAHTLTQTGPFRPSHRAGSIDGLYYTGGFTGPGIGVPMTVLSGRQTAEAVIDDRGEVGGLRSLLVR